MIGSADTAASMEAVLHDCGNEPAVLRQRVSELEGEVCTLRHLTGQQQLLATAFDAMREALVVTDADNRILSVNRAFTEVTGYAPEEAVGRTPALLHSGRHPRGFYQDMWETLGRNNYWAGEIWNRRKDGEVYPEWLAISVLRKADGTINGYIAIFSDISGRKRSENDLIRLANFDALTGLPNRALLFDRIRGTLAIARRHKSRAALLFVDLDRFKGVNDAYGHREGDTLLVDASRRIVGCLRESDTVARIGGDEFVAVLGFASGEHEVAEVARKIIAAVGKPFQIGANSHHIGASIGIAIYPDDGEDEETLLRHADAAMYKAKQSGRNLVRHTSRIERQRLEHEARIEQEMHAALANRDFFLVFQPQVDARNGHLAGFEALIRWRLPDGSTMAPAEFIPVAERTGFIADLDRHVIELGTRQLRVWQREGLEPPPVSFNLSPQEFQREGIELEVMRQIRGQGLPPSLIGIEVTESSAMADLKKTIQVLETWRKLGIKVAIDDFGTGHSSLAYLRHFPASSLKIDQSFVRSIGRSIEDSALVETMLEIARTLQLAVVAEGVETLEQYEFLRDRGCDLIQGYYFSRPLSVEAAVELLRRNTPLQPSM